MADLKEAGFWIVASGTAGTILWNVLNYMRAPAFVRRSSYDELIESNERMRAEIVGMRAEMADLRSANIELKAEVRRLNFELKAEVRRLMEESEFYRDQYRELKAKTERG